MVFPTGWGRKCELVIQSSQVTDNETDFPIVIKRINLPDEPFDADGTYPALNGGGDIRISSDSAGNNRLACEIEKFITDNDPANGEVTIWVKVPNVSSSSNTSIWIWYNKSGETQPAADATFGAESVWKSSYKLVQHMNQDPSGSSPQMQDSTSNDANGISTGTMLTEDLIAGKINKALDFDGSDDGIEFTDIDGATPFPQVEVSAWVQMDTKADFTAIFEKSDFSTNTNMVFRLFLDDSVDQKWRFKVWGADGVTAGNVDSNAAAATGSFVHIVCKYDGSTVTMTVNGVVQTITQSETGSLRDASNNFRLAYNYFYNTDCKGCEVRVLNAANSTNWTLTEYNNQNSPSTFIIEGTPESPVVGWVGIFNGISSTNIAKINGIPIANIAKVNGVASS